MFRAVVLLAIASVVLAALALISCLSVEDKREIRGMPRFVWVLAILLLPLLGPIGWFVSGRPTPLGGGPAGWLQATGHAEPPRPTAPDDDPDFLRSLAQHTRDSDQPPDRRERGDGRSSQTPPRTGDSPTGADPASGADATAGDPDAVDGGTLSEEDKRLLQQWEQDLQRGDGTGRPGGSAEQGEQPGRQSGGQTETGEQSNEQSNEQSSESGNERGGAQDDDQDRSGEEERRRRDSGSDS